MKTLLPAILAMAVIPALASAESIEVFLIRGVTVAPLNDPAVKVYWLDSLRKLEEDLSARARAQVRSQTPALSGSLYQAMFTAEVKRALADPTASAAFAPAAEALAAATNYGIEKVPAIVFDHCAIVYGVNDLAQARAIYRRSPKKTSCTP